MLHSTPSSATSGGVDSSVKLHHHSSDEVFHETNIGTRAKCQFCYKADSKYTCPRCNFPYCSVNCFKSSNHAGCAESFYQDCMMQEMKSQTFTKSEKLKVMKMIQEHERSCEDDEEDEVESLQRRLEGVDVDNEDHLWTVLTDDEKADFKRSMEAGCLIDEWTPWWYYHDKSLIRELDESADMLDDCIPSTVPSVKLDVPKLSKLLSGKVPSPLVANNLVEVLYVYAFYTRKYNGSPNDFASEFCYNMVFSSTFLVDGITRPTLLEAAQITMERCESQNRNTTASREVIEILLDIYHILVGPRRDDIALYAKASIAEAHGYCKSLKQSRNKDSHIERTTVKKTLKKLEFLYSWVDQYALQLPIIATAVLNIFKSKMNWRRSHEEQKNAIDQSKQNVVAQNQLIKEIT